MKNLRLKLISIILIAATLCSVLASCGTSEDENASASDSDNAQSVIVDPEGVITVFANGAYNAKIIRGEKATQTERTVYDQIRSLFNTRTGVTAAIDTDYVTDGGTLYDGPAILIGETAYEESKSAYATIGNDQAFAKVVGNKYVISFSTQDAADDLVAKLKSLINVADKTTLKIESSWAISVKLSYQTSGTETFDATGLKSSASLPGNLGDKYDVGQGSYTYVKSNASKTDFDSLCKAAETNGFKKYTTNTIGNNSFATYVTQTQILHFMHFANKNEIRTAVDKRGSGMNGYVLPGLSGDNKYASTTKSLMTLVDIENSSWPGGMCLIFKLCDGRFVVVDSGIGGRDNDGSSSGWVYQSLKKHASDPKNIKVAAWIFTHIHSDHIGGLVDMARGTYNTTLKKDGEAVKTHNVMPREIKSYIKIDTIICNYSNNDFNGYRSWVGEIVNAFKVKNVVRAHPGQVFYFANCKFTIFGSLDLVAEKKISNHNDESLSMTFEFNGKKLLVLGDAFPQNTAALAAIYKESLKADIVQTAHHGYDNTDAGQVYEYVQATMVLWPVAGYEKDQENLVNAKVNAIFKSIPADMQFTPRGKNIDFDENWKKSTSYSLMEAIPKCDCASCKSGTAIRSSGN